MPKDRKSSKEMAHLASGIMELAKHGGPVMAFEKELQEQFPETPINTEFLQRFDAILRPYISQAESLAASVLSQRAK